MMGKEINASNGEVKNYSEFNEVVGEINNYHFTGKRVDEPNEGLVMFKNKRTPFLEYNNPRYFYCQKVGDNLTEHTLQWSLPMKGKEIFDEVCSYLRHHDQNFSIQTSDACDLSIDFYFIFNLPLVCYPGNIRINGVDDKSSVMTLKYKYDDSVYEDFNEVYYEIFMFKDVQSELECIVKHLVWEAKSKIEDEFRNLFYDSGIAVALGHGVSNYGFGIDEGFDFCSSMTTEQKNRLIDLAHSLKFKRIVSIRIHSYDNIEILGQTEEEVKKEIVSAIVNKKMALRGFVRDVFPDMRYFPIYVDDEVYDVSLYLNLQKKTKIQRAYPFCYDTKKLKAELKRRKSISALKISFSGVEIID